MKRKNGFSGISSDDVLGMSSENIEVEKAKEVQREAWNEYRHLSRDQLKEEARKLWAQQQQHLGVGESKSPEAQKEASEENRGSEDYSIRIETAMSLYYLKRNIEPEAEIPPWEEIASDSYTPK